MPTCQKTSAPRDRSRDPYTIQSKDGGSCHATMRFKPEAGHGANAGLGIARERLNRVKDQFPEISYGDIWTLAGIVAIQEMGGPIINWNSTTTSSVVVAEKSFGMLFQSQQVAAAAILLLFTTGWTMFMIFEDIT
ncbi:heme peroxidase [Modicella reniformis]|uniref:Peroxidase n=1 Tax=Modicella reniformis TaxID=1440133 RepID=A0A9P6LTL8_9FUNG|nr:heme peroxidase [Modicella reniformis]